MKSSKMPGFIKMTKCKNIEKKLILYLYDLLDNDEYKKVKQHLKICPVCRRKLRQLLKIKIALKTTPDDTPPDNLNKQQNKNRKKII